MAEEAVEEAIEEDLGRPRPSRRRSPRKPIEEAIVAEQAGDLETAEADADVAEAAAEVAEEAADEEVSLEAILEDLKRREGRTE